MNKDSGRKTVLYACIVESAMLTVGRKIRVIIREHLQLGTV